MELKKRQHECMNSTHVKSILGKLTHSKRNDVDIVPGKTHQTVSWVKINKHRQNVNDPSLLDLLKKVKPWVEDLSRLFHSLDTVWLTPDIKQFISQQGHVKCKFPWSDDYTAMVSCYFVHILLQNSMPLFYANDDKYATPLSDVDQERLPVVLLGAKVFDKKRIDPTDYCIRFNLADSVPKHGAMNDPEEFYDALFCLRDDKRVEYNTLMAINDVIAKAEEKLTTKEAHLEIIEAEVNPHGFTGKLANLNLADLYDDKDLHFGNAFADDMPIMDEVVFKIHKTGILSLILQGLKLIHTDNDVYSFFADAERSGKIHLYITHKQQDLGRYYLRNMVWVEEDAALRCSSSSSFSTRIKRKGGKTTKEGLRKKAKGEQKMVDDEPVGRKSVQTSLKGKEIMYEFHGPSPTKESQVSVTNYKRSIVNGKAKMVEVEEVGLVQPVGSATKVQRSTAKVCQLTCSSL
ncbi:hypothetical protein Tco_0663014 [Tanacetum coccineum]